MTDLVADRLAFERTDRAAATVAAAPRGLGFRFDGIGKQFGDKIVLRDLSLSVPAGRFVAIVGKSGCGKSTLLRILAGLDQPSAGALLHDDRSIRPARMMFQEPRLLPWARIIDNVAVGLTGIARGDDARARAQTLLEEVGLGDRAGEWPSVLSGGQKQRVALARALVS